MARKRSPWTQELLELLLELPLYNLDCSRTVLLTYLLNGTPILSIRSLILATLVLTQLSILLLEQSSSSKCRGWTPCMKNLSHECPWTATCGGQYWPKSLGHVPSVLPNKQIVHEHNEQTEHKRTPKPRSLFVFARNVHQQLTNSTNKFYCIK